MTTGVEIFQQSEIVDKICGKEKADIARQILTQSFMEYDKTHVLKLFVFCLSEHCPDDNDGKLSMWRAYGSGGNGAAIVFNTEPVFKWDDSPLIFAKVDYASTMQRKAKLERIIKKWCHVVAKNHIPDEIFWVAPISLFEIFKLVALTSKHNGFEEAQEWRVIYMPERDSQNMLTDRISYDVGNRGVEPKLKLKIASLPGSPAPSPVCLASFLDRIILGPSISSPLAANCFREMLKQKKPEFVHKVVASTIPLRPA